MIISPRPPLDLRYILPDLIVGSITRETVQSAVAHNVSAADIQAFLERNAHPRMACQTPVLPDTVVNQVMLWARERHRLEFAGARRYEHVHTRDPTPAPTLPPTPTPTPTLT